jgi:6-phosphofructokinase
MLRGKLLIGQSGGPTPVINASLAGVIMEAASHPQVEAVYGLVHGIEGALKEELVDLNQESPQTIQLLIQTPASALGSCRHKVEDNEYERILEVFKAHDIRHFVYIGGNDSMDTCRCISDLARSTGYELQVMGVPKTIDNDLAYTDHTPGYGSAARFLALAARDAGLDLESMATFDDVTILEAMGRNTGWLSAASALGKESEEDAPHLVYLPEIPFDETRFLADVAAVHTRLGRVFVAVCEGVRNAQGEYVGHNQTNVRTDAFGHALPTLTTGVASYLSSLVHSQLKLQSRFLRPVLIGRAFSACIAETDRREALQAGQKAVACLADGQSGLMVTLERLSSEPYRCEPGLIALAQVANQEKLMPRAFINEEGNMVTEAFRAYAMPLIDGPLPAITRLERKRVPSKLNRALD